MRLIIKFKFLYVLILIFYGFFLVFLRPRPKLNSFFVKESDSKISNYKTKNDINIINPPTNKVNVGKSFSIKDNENWFQVIQLSFWREEYLNLDFLNNQLKITDINVKSINNNNYASGKFQGEDIVYSCMKNLIKFQYSIPEKIVDSFNIKHWVKVYLNNLNFVFYSFKPRNYECYVVITSNTNFFENSDFEINKKIFKKFIYD